MVIHELSNFNSESPKIMEDVINSNTPKQEEYLSKLLNEQDLVQNLINVFELFSAKTLKFRDFRSKSLILLNPEKYQTPGSIIHEVPEHLENLPSADVKRDREMINSMNSDNLKGTNLDIAMQKNKEPSKESIHQEPHNKNLDGSFQMNESNKLNIKDESLRKLNQNASSFKENDKILKDPELNSNRLKLKDEGSFRMKESVGSFKEKNNESNQFMKEAEAHFEEEVSLSQFKQINLSANFDKEKESIGNKNHEIENVLDDLKHEKPDEIIKNNKHNQRKEVLDEEEELTRNNKHNQRKDDELIRNNKHNQRNGNLEDLRHEEIGTDLKHPKPIEILKKNQNFEEDEELIKSNRYNPRKEALDGLKHENNEKDKDVIKHNILDRKPDILNELGHEKPSEILRKNHNNEDLDELKNEKNRKIS